MVALKHHPRRLYRLLFLAVVLGAAVFMTSGFARAGVYKFVDSQGVTHYTDEILEVPVDQRPPMQDQSVKTAKDQVRPATVTTASLDKERSEKQTGLTKTVGADAERLSAGKGQFEKLQQMRRQLDAEYDAITGEQQRLKGVRDNLRTSEERAAFKEAVTKLDARIEAYEKQRHIVTVQVEQYNEQIGKLDEKRKALQAEIEAYNGSTGNGS